MKRQFRWSSWAVSHPGKVREVNEDAYLELPQRGLWAVADGMGGHHAGDLASNAIVAALRDLPDREDPAEVLDEVEDRLLDVNLRLFQTAMAGGLSTIGSTVVVLLALGRYAVLIWAGDSRAYRYRDGRLEQLTRDHSQVEELVALGQLSREEADQHPLSNVITRAVGGGEDLQLDLDLVELQDGDRFMLCSDGLYKELRLAEISAILADESCPQTCEALLRRALQTEAADNITFTLIEFESLR